MTNDVEAPRTHVARLYLAMAAGAAAVLAAVMLLPDGQPEPRHWMEAVAQDECGDLVPDGPIKTEEVWMETYYRTVWIFEQRDGGQVHVYARPDPGSTWGIQDGFDCTPED